MKKILPLIALSLLAGCSDQPEATVHIDGQVDVTVTEKKAPRQVPPKNPIKTIVGNEKRY